MGDKFNAETKEINKANLPSQSVNIILNASPLKLANLKKIIFCKDLSIKATRHQFLQYGWWSR